jgi:enamine deaminase RidA (YjgF/YER057c/UK114 family)
VGGRDGGRRVAGHYRPDAPALATIEKNLATMGSGKHRIVSAQVYVASLKDKAAMDAVWNEWLGGNPDHWPQRACLGVALEGGALVEITVTAVRG